MSSIGDEGQSGLGEGVCGGGVPGRCVSGEDGRGVEGVVGGSSLDVVVAAAAGPACAPSLSSSFRMGTSLSGDDSDEEGESSVFSTVAGCAAPLVGEEQCADGAGKQPCGSILPKLMGWTFIVIVVWGKLPGRSQLDELVN